jgi:hypothetical protein
LNNEYFKNLLNDEKLLKKNLIEPLLQEAQELTAIFAASRKTASKKDKMDRIP